MGLKHSASIASLAFYNAVEAPLFQRRPLRSNGIISYTRFHDDILMIVATRQQALDFVLDFRQNSAYFTVEVRDVSQFFIQHLDLNVSVVDEAIKVGPTLEKVPIPLFPSSADPFHIHKGWPSLLSSA